MPVKVIDRIWSPIFVLLGMAALGVTLLNFAGLSLPVAIICVLGGLLTIALGFFCFSTR